MKRKLVLLTVICMMSICSVGCTDNGGNSNDTKTQSDIPGSTKTSSTTAKITEKTATTSDESAPITEKTGNLEDYAGRWKAEESDTFAPFFSIEIFADGTGEVTCYNRNGEIVDSGYADYDEQRALNGKSLIVFSFDNIGEFGATVTSMTGGERRLDIKFGEKSISFISPFYTAMRTDLAIDQAITAIEEVKRNDLSDVSYPYEQPTNDFDTADKAMYDEILEKAKSFTPFSYTPAEHGYDEMDRALRVYYVLSRDYPEVENYFYVREVLEGDVTTAIKGRYFLPWDEDIAEANIEELRYETALFDAVCDRIVERMPEGLSTYDKYYYLASVISFITTYDYDNIYGRQIGTAYGALVSGHSICQGYSRGFKALCQKANLWCEYAEGEYQGTAHMWNFVKLDTGTYHIDITWADEKGLPGNVEWERNFMLTQEEVLVEHNAVYDNLTATGTPIAK
ncbi:MAG: hypothetical protein LBM93_06890 [Oscillospiraceae bacterium]|jgi:hypothetical protein|nr:hypothetical protein [Oscillospiraceae bacterium]